MRKLSVVAALLLLFAMPSQASAADWVELGKNQNGEPTYVDISSIKSNGSIVRYWARSEHVNNRDNWKEVVILSENNCATGQSRRLQATIYMVDGTGQNFPDPTHWKYVTPETRGEIIHTFVCAFHAKAG